MLRTNKTLKILDLSNCKLNNKSFNVVIKGLKLEDNNNNNNSNNLNKLILMGNDLKEECGKDLSIFITYFSKLKWLNISKNNIKNSGFRFLLKKILDIITVTSSVINLETIVAYNIGLKDEDSISILAKIVENKNCKLKSIILSDNDIGSGTSHYIYNFFTSMGKNKSVNELLLLNCHLSNNCVNYICDMLVNNKTLEKLCLYNNNIDNPDEFFKILEIFMKKDNTVSKNNTLKELDISKNKCDLPINEKFLMIIKNIYIESLDISQNLNFINSVQIELFKKVTKEVQNRIKIIY